MEKRPTAKDIIQMLNALDQAEAQEELTSVTQCTEKLLVQNTTASKDLAPQSVTEEIFINKEDGEVGEEVTSYDCLSPTPLSELSTGNLNYQEGAKASTEPQSARGTTTESEMFEKLSHTEYKVTLKAVCALQGETTFEAIPPLIKIISVENRVHDNISSIDTNQIEPLIIVAGFSSGSVYLWNYDMQKMIHLIELHAGKVSSVRFVARKQWFLAGTHDGFVYVFNYERAQKITIFKAHNGYLYSLAVHPTQPYLLLACSSYQLKLWKGWFGWKCVQTFVGHLENVRRVAFNPENTNSFVSASDDHTIKVWNIHSPICNYTLRGHSGGVTSLDFFTRDGHQYLVTGSNDRTAKIWDMQKKECVCTLEHHTSAVLSVVSHPNLPLLVTGTYGGLVYLWSSTDFRLIRIVSISGHYSIGGLACLIGSGRVVVAHNEGLSVIEIRDEEQVASKGNSGNSIYARQRQIRKSKAISATD